MKRGTRVNSGEYFLRTPGGTLDPTARRSP